MTPERWQRVKSIFDEAVDRNPEQREALLEEQCGEDKELLEQVRSLLASDHATTDSVLVSPLAGGGAAAAFAAAQAVDPMIGRTAGPYRVIREIGRGGMGCVYLAQRADDQFRRRVALKTVNPALVDKHALHRFENERQTMALLDHPNIIKLLDGGTTEQGLPWLAMDYVEGEAIDKYCATHKLGVAERLTLFRTVCAAVHYAHQNLVIHRDLKPSNILITSDGVPKLLDFGIAKLLRPEFSLHTVGQTLTEMQPMTLQFASPEQIRGLPITTASDIYSLGILLYYLIAGRHPYTATSLLDLQHAICETEPQRPSTVVNAIKPDTKSSVPPQRISVDLDMIVLMALRKEPQRRYASVQHLADDVRRLLEGRPVLARKDTLTYRVSRLISRNRAGTAAASIAAAALLVTGLFALQEYRQSQRRSHELRLFTEAVLNLDEGLQSGLTAARASMLRKAIDSLDNLARESSGDSELQKDLVRAYIKMADVQGNAQNANLGQTATAETLYEKARPIAEELARGQPADSDGAKQLATLNSKIGEMLYAKGDYSRALGLFNGALQSREKLLAGDPSSHGAQRDVLAVVQKIGETYDRLGDPAAALDTYLRGLDAARAISIESQASMQNLIALYSARSGEAEKGEAAIGEALKIYESVAGFEPTTRNRWKLGQAYMTQSEVLKDAGKIPEALASIKHGLGITESLHKEDPSNEQFTTDLYMTLAFLVDLDLMAGNKEEAHDQTRRALSLLKPYIEKGDDSIYPLYYYTWILTRTPFPDQQNHAAALAAAKRGAELTHNSDPEFLQLLAAAYRNDGDRSHAREALEKALSLLPPAKPGRRIPQLRRSLEGDLAKL